MTHPNALAGPRARIRIAHSKTVKNGWQHETSVEFEWGSDDPDANAERWLRRLLEGADKLGREESARRTALDAGEAAA